MSLTADRAIDYSRSADNHLIYIHRKEKTQVIQTIANTKFEQDLDNRTVFSPVGMSAPR